MDCRGPRQFGVAPVTAHTAARQPDEESASASMGAFSLQGVKGLHHRQREGVSGIGQHNRFQYPLTLLNGAGVLRHSGRAWLGWSVQSVSR